MRFTRSLCAALLVAATATTAIAASTTAGISGLVKDPAGNPVAGAAVAMTHQDFGTRFALTSDARGKFVQVGVKAGSWEVAVEKAGFAASRQVLHLKLGSPTRAEIVLEPAGAAGSSPAAAGFSLNGLRVSGEAGAAYQKAQAAVAAGDPAAARASLEALIALEPALPAPYFVLAELHRGAGDGKKAADLLRQGLERQPDEVSAWIALGEVHGDLGDNGEAARSFARAAALAPQDPRPRRKLGMALILSQDFAGAVSALETYLALAPAAPDAAEKRALVDELKKSAGK
jgi:tetratricopeptide (TPR) repeat protein